VTFQRPALIVAMALAGLPQTLSIPQTPRVSRDVQLSQAETWTSTEIVVAAGERVVFTAKGSVRCPGDASEAGPQGLARGFRDLVRSLPVNQAGRGALVGRIGEAGVARPFFIGSSSEVTAPSGGALALGVNRQENDPCAAAFAVHVDVFAAGTVALVAPAISSDSLEEVNKDLFAKLPRRVNDQQGNLGDMINFLILGSTEAMQRTFRTAGWVTVDADTVNAVVTGVLSSLSKESYLTLPMSRLYLFKRSQDYGWAHAEPLKVAASRHHLRVWQAPFQVAGAVVWVGAATHDIGFERDQRNNGITHKIDPNVDDEREFVEKTLTGTGLVATFTYVTPEDPVGEAKTATGGTFRSDGRILVLKLREGSAR
jgi:LssY C-terminus